MGEEDVRGPEGAVIERAVLPAQISFESSRENRLADLTNTVAADPGPPRRAQLCDSMLFLRSTVAGDAARYR